MSNLAKPEVRMASLYYLYYLYDHLLSCCPHDFPGCLDRNIEYTKTTGDVICSLLSGFKSLTSWPFEMQIFQEVRHTVEQGAEPCLPSHSLHCMYLFHSP